MSSQPNRTVRYESPGLRLFVPQDGHAPGRKEPPSAEEPGLQALEERLKRFPASMGALLIVLGVVDMAIPFTPMVGTALVGLGCVNLCAHTNTLGHLDRWLARRAPRTRGRAVVCTTEMLHVGEGFGPRFRADLAARFGE